MSVRATAKIARSHSCNGTPQEKCQWPRIIAPMTQAASCPTAKTHNAQLTGLTRCARERLRPMITNPSASRKMTPIDATCSAENVVKCRAGDTLPLPLLDQFLETPGAGPACPLERLIIHVHQTETDSRAVVPFKIIQQRPVTVTDDIGSLLHGLIHLFVMLLAKTLPPDVVKF